MNSCRDCARERIALPIALWEIAAKDETRYRCTDSTKPAQIHVEPEVALAAFDVTQEDRDAIRAAFLVGGAKSRNELIVALILAHRSAIVPPGG